MVSTTNFFVRADALGDWLERQHKLSDEIWVGLYKKASSWPTVTWDEVVDEALCYGWIDGTRRTIDATSWRIRLTPRRPGSRWSAKNVSRARELSAAGRMTPAGQLAFDARPSHEREGYTIDNATETEFPAAAQAALTANADAWSFFCAQPPGYRNAARRWVMSAKREETRHRRLDTLIHDSANELRIKPLRKTR